MKTECRIRPIMMDRGIRNTGLSFQIPYVKKVKEAHRGKVKPIELGKEQTHERLFILQDRGGRSPPRRSMRTTRSMPSTTSTPRPPPTSW